MESIADLFGTYHYVKPGGKMIDERSGIIGYFAKEINRPAKYIGVRLGHYTLSDLYALQSAYKDRLQRNGRETADKYWWYITRVVDNPTTSC